MTTSKYRLKTVILVISLDFLLHRSVDKETLSKWYTKKMVYVSYDLIWSSKINLLVPVDFLYISNLSFYQHIEESNPVICFVFTDK